MVNSMNNDNTLDWLENELKLWNRQLKVNTEIAHAQIKDIVKDLATKFNRYDVAKYNAGLKSGLYCPQDFKKSRVPS